MPIFLRFDNYIKFLKQSLQIDYFTVVDLAPSPSSKFETEGVLVLILTSFALVWKLSLKNTS